MADEDDDGAILLLDRDRMALLVVVGNGGRDRFVMLAAAKGERHADERAAEVDGAPANLGWSCDLHEVPVPPQSVMKP